MRRTIAVCLLLPLASPTLYVWSVTGAADGLLVEAGSQSDSSSCPAAICFRAQPLPGCRSFLITEFGVTYRVNAPHQFRRQLQPEDRICLGFELGWMGNVSPNHAVGLGTWIALESDGPRLALKGRYRNWVAPGVSTDLALGYVVDQWGSRYGIDLHRREWLLAALSVGLNDRIHIAVRYESIKQDSPIGNAHPWRQSIPRTTERVSAFYLGLKSGGELGPRLAGWAALGLLVATWIALSASGGMMS